MVQWTKQLGACGLSPRVRGNRMPSAVKRQVSGSIPACAGEPGRPQPLHRISRVYPRVCGGTVLIAGSEWYGHGLSPRVRGNLAYEFHILNCAGSIPACAGEPCQGCP